MEETYYTIGMAGHIDHGKTTLTKALTGMDTDRLKHEKERKISIELGYAQLEDHDGSRISIVDVPGHERFIRQMIAGVAGIDLVVLVVAADEGVMPQTKEHLEILKFLGIKRCVIAVTKIDRVDAELLELVELEINDTLQDRDFAEAEIAFVDSISYKGIDAFKQLLLHELQQVKVRDRYGAFRMPIDQVFTIQGQGTIARGTVYEGQIQTGAEVTILPKKRKAKVRTMQIHHQNVSHAYAGQRTALNVSGINRDDLQRGDVMVLADHFLVTGTIDVSLQFVEHLRAPLKQRAPVKIHVGTSEVMGKIIYFDRNVVKQGKQEVICQIRLDEDIVVRRGDRFIVRRPTPTETIAGGWIIDPNGKKYKFGSDTIQYLQKKKEGTPEELVLDELRQNSIMDMKQMMVATSIDEWKLKKIVEQQVIQGELIELPREKYMHRNGYMYISDKLLKELDGYHQQYPMRLGMNKAELIQPLTGNYPKEVIEFIIRELSGIEQVGQFIKRNTFEPHLPAHWKSRMEEFIHRWKQDGLKVKKWEDYLGQTPFTEEDKEDLKAYLLFTEQAYQITDGLVIHKQAFVQAIQHLRNQTGTSFTLQDAKEAWGISRKYLIPILEKTDQLNLTARKGNARIWLSLGEG
ncbi:selenocysteine-specific translation elongation factor [Aquibacillus sediminis]|uniref:selenocysteine-specific translation elongation factor n=1 Tax=Aquibacillus sediminis TaxID=2574734 RepID=UPI001109041C|nr:selenocysteine-specific translation elongation factor [Aquibacillus sediminis]